MLPAGLPWIVIWTIFTFGIAWLIGLKAIERRGFTEALIHGRG